MLRKCRYTFFAVRRLNLNQEHSMEEFYKKGAFNNLAKFAVKLQA